MDEPDAFEKTRLILARARRQGQPFEEIWPLAVEAAAPAIHCGRTTYLLISPDREKLSPSELEWLNEDALPGLWIEWIESKPLRG